MLNRKEDIIVFKELDLKIESNSLSLKDITDQALAINVALREKLPDNPEFRNPVIQGYIAWLIMYDYLKKNQERLDKNILEFLNVSLKGKLEKVAEALSKDFNARIRDDINALNEAEIILRSKTGVVYNYYTEDQKIFILNSMKAKGYIKDNHQLNAIFYLTYRERDGRFFCISDIDLDLRKELNIDLPIAEITSTHITLNEGINCKEIFEEHFKEKATKDLPCKVISKEPLLFCGIQFEDVMLNVDEMYQLELCKNPPVEKVNILRVTGEICKFKESLNFPVLNIIVPLHINIGVTPRKMSLEIANSKKSILDMIDSNNPFAEPLRINLTKPQYVAYARMFQPAIIENKIGNSTNKETSFSLTT